MHPVFPVLFSTLAAFAPYKMKPLIWDLLLLSGNFLVTKKQEKRDRKRGKIEKKGW